MSGSLDRRSFLRSAAATGAAIGLASSTSPFCFAAETEAKQPLFKISLAEWSLHRALFDKKIDNLDFPRIAKSDYGIDARRVRQPVSSRTRPRTRPTSPS